MTEEPVELISERDKPFYLALVSAFIMMVGVLFCMINNKWDFITTWVGLTSPYMSMSWAWYFHENTKK